MVNSLQNQRVKIKIEGLNVFYYRRPTLQNISMEIRENTLTCIVGPSGCGKSTLLMAMNRLLDIVPQARVQGSIAIRTRSGRWFEVNRLPETELPALRRRVGLVFQHPNVLPTSIVKNVAFPLKLLGLDRQTTCDRVREALKKVFLWDEVKDQLQAPAAELSGGQQQRLCLARVLAMEPEVLLLDEPTAFLDENLARKIESLLFDFKSHGTVIVVSHYLDQVKRISDFTYRLHGNKDQLDTKQS